MDNDVKPTTENGASGVTGSIMIFLGGAAAGAVAALLLAPKNGQECRKQLLQYGRRTGETISGWVGKGYATVATKQEGEAKPTVQETETGTPGETTWRRKAIIS